jgi:hypothetical protein
MHFKPELYHVLLTWTIAFSIIEPIVTALNYTVLKDIIKPVYQVHQGTNPSLVAMSEYVYYTSIFIKTMWVYKYVLGKASFFPNVSKYQDCRDFVACFIAIQLLANVIYVIVIKLVPSTVPFMSFVKQYTHEVGFILMLRTIAFACMLLFVTGIIYKFVDDLMALGMLLFGIFVATAASF